MSDVTKTALSKPAVAKQAFPDTAPIHGLHHFAYRCKDAEETRQFYEDILGLPLYHIIQSDHVPSTGEFCPYTHIFFRMRDGSCIAFFDLGRPISRRESDANSPNGQSHCAASRYRRGAAAVRRGSRRMATK